MNLHYWKIVPIISIKNPSFLIINITRIKIKLAEVFHLGWSIEGPRPRGTVNSNTNWMASFESFRVQRRTFVVKKFRLFSSFRAHLRTNTGAWGSFHLCGGIRGLSTVVKSFLRDLQNRKGESFIMGVTCYFCNFKSTANILAVFALSISSTSLPTSMWILYLMRAVSNFSSNLSFEVWKIRAPNFLEPWNGDFITTPFTFYAIEEVNAKPTAFEVRFWSNSSLCCNANMYIQRIFKKRKPKKKYTN